MYMYSITLIKLSLNDFWNIFKLTNYILFKQLYKNHIRLCKQLFTKKNKRKKCMCLFKDHINFAMLKPKTDLKELIFIFYWIIFFCANHEQKISKHRVCYTVLLSLHVQIMKGNVCLLIFRPNGHK